uniref:Uncharacterized protein n=1 Tax=Arundo donax TaxID=35708 RepID=A0A0A9HH57_ARUDO
MACARFSSSTRLIGLQVCSLSDVKFTLVVFSECK